MCVCVPRILAIAATRAAFILLRVPDCAATIQEQRPFESSVHSKKHRYGSFVLRPSPPPIVDLLQYVSTEGEGLENLVICSGIS